MKILFALRLYSGLENSVIDERWQPGGIPTIYKLLEGLDKKHEIKVLLFHKIPSEMQYSKYKEKYNKTVSFSEFKGSFEVISSIYNNKTSLNKFQKIIEELSHFRIIFKYISKENPDLIYIDNSNIWSAGLIARIKNTPVVLRLLGIYPYIAKLSLKKLNIYQRILKWLFRAPYALVINTNDGSGKNIYVKNLLKKNTNYQLLMNGVDIPKFNTNKVSQRLNFTKTKLVCLFISKLETYKGCIIFVETMIEAMKKGIELHAIIIGEGSQKTKIISIINNEKLSSNFSILGNIPHKDIFYYHSISHVYISLNQLGNISNSNLEAIKFGQVVIFPRELDNETDGEDIKIFGDKNILWIKNSYDKSGLISHLENINNDPSILTSYKNKILTVSKSLPSWKERINKEVLILESIINKRNLR